MAEVKWIKIATSIFDNRKIRQIETLPEGDSIIVIWFKLLCLAGNINDKGYIYFTSEIPYTEQMLATQFNRPLPVVQLALKTFEQFGMVEIIEDIIKVSSWEKYQNIEGMEKMREQNRIRKQKQREREKLALEDVSRDTSRDVTQQNKKEEEDKDIDIDIDKDIYISIVEYLNEKVGTCFKSTTKKTQSCIHARLEEGFTLDDFKTVIDKKADEWKGTEFEQYLRPETLFGTKFEGYLNQKIKPKDIGNPNLSYKTKSNTDQYKPKNAYRPVGVTDRQYDWDSLERGLLRS